MRVYDEFREFFDPRIRAAKRHALEAAARSEVDARKAAFAADAVALRESQVISQFHDQVLGYAASLLPNEEMDAAGAFWMRRGLENAVSMLDEILAAAENDE